MVCMCVLSPAHTNIAVAMLCVHSDEREPLALANCASGNTVTTNIHDEDVYTRRNTSCAGRHEKRRS